jgi:hypothetical protein
MKLAKITRELLIWTSLASVAGSEADDMASPYAFRRLGDKPRERAQLRSGEASPDNFVERALGLKIGLELE